MVIMCDVPYMRELKKIRDVLEDKLLFYPSSDCQVATRVIHELVGLEEKAGRYVSDSHLGNRWHAWNYDPELKLYIDLSQDQFPDCADPICILPEDTPLLEEIADRTQDQKEYADDEFEEDVNKVLEYFL